MLTGLCREDLRQVVELTHRCVAVESFSDLSAILTAVGSFTSFDRAVLCAFRSGDDGSLEHFVNHSFGRDWEDAYLKHGLERVDPVLHHARRVCGAFRWRDALDGSCSTAGLAFFQAAREFGLVEGVAYARRSRASFSTTILSLAAPEDRGSDRTLALLAALGPNLADAYERLRKRDLTTRSREVGEGGKRVALSAREREILGWTQYGKTYWEIGQIIGISERTVKYHFTRIKTKLDVVSASHAVAKAMRMGLLA
jgi:DNA-binding CsgD family transcriptional regulator